jgi:hypothetical protein
VRQGGCVSKGVAITMGWRGFAPPQSTRRGVHLYALPSVMAIARRTYPELKDYMDMISTRDAKALRRVTTARDRQRRGEEVRRLLAQMGDAKGTYMGLGKALGYVRSGAWSLQAVAKQARYWIEMDQRRDRAKRVLITMGDASASSLCAPDIERFIVGGDVTLEESLERMRRRRVVMALLFTMRVSFKHVEESANDFINSLVDDIDRIRTEAEGVKRTPPI